MKFKKLKKKLNLNKSTVDNLSIVNQNAAKGGAVSPPDSQYCNIKTSKTGCTERCVFTDYGCVVSLDYIGNTCDDTDCPSFDLSKCARTLCC